MATKKVKKKQITDFKHDIRTEHLDATGDDKGKWIRSNPDTGDIEYTQAPVSDKHITVTITHMHEVVVEHGLNKNPAVQVLGEDSKDIIAQIEHLNVNEIKIVFVDYVTGKIIIN